VRGWAEDVSHSCAVKRARPPTRRRSPAQADHHERAAGHTLTRRPPEPSQSPRPATRQAHRPAVHPHVQYRLHDYVLTQARRASKACSRTASWATTHSFAKRQKSPRPGGRLRGAVQRNQHARDRRAQSRPTMSAAETRRGSGSRSIRGSWPTIPSPCSDNQEPQDRQVGRTGRDQRSHKDLAKQALLRTARLARSRRGSMVRICCESAHGIFGCGHPRLPLPQAIESGHQRPPKPTRATLCVKPACHSESPFLEWLLSA
jgi:hypothetical protein